MFYIKYNLSYYLYFFKIIARFKSTEGMYLSSKGGNKVSFFDYLLMRLIPIILLIAMVLLLFVYLGWVIFSIDPIWYIPTVGLMALTLALFSSLVEEKERSRWALRWLARLASCLAAGGLFNWIYHQLF
jgi:fatty acid desaturase